MGVVNFHNRPIAATLKHKMATHHCCLVEFWTKNRMNVVTRVLEMRGCHGDEQLPLVHWLLTLKVTSALQTWQPVTGKQWMWIAADAPASSYSLQTVQYENVCLPTLMTKLSQKF